MPSPLALCSALEQFATSAFGSWPNVTQGLIGSALGSGLGVFGAYLVAAKQMRHERDTHRMSAGGQAATTILGTLLPLTKQLKALGDLHPDDWEQDGLSRWHRNRWQEATAPFEVDVLLHAHLLPKKVAEALHAALARLDEVVVWEVDEENRVLIYVDVAAPEALAEITGLVNKAQKSLTEYARSTLGDPR